MKRYLKRAIILLLVLVTNMSLMGCTSLEELHCTKEQAQVIAEELTGQKVTYVTTNEIAEDKKKIYIFADGQGREFAILTDEITRAWSGMSTREYKNYKGLKKENLRDNMSTTEIVLNMLAETATKEISKQVKPQGFEDSR